MLAEKKLSSVNTNLGTGIVIDINRIRCHFISLEEQQYATISEVNNSSLSPPSNTTGYEYISEGAKKQTNVKILSTEAGNQYYDYYNTITNELLEYTALTDQSSPTEATVYMNMSYDKSQDGDITDITYAVPSSSVHTHPPPPSTIYDPQIPPTLPISLDDLGTHVASCHSNGNAAFNEQYKVIIMNNSILLVLSLNICNDYYISRVID